jgi:hypothetical protein
VWDDPTPLGYRQYVVSRDFAIGCIGFVSMISPA